MDTVLLDRYRVIRRAGRGGMGTVYHAEDLRDGGEVALKVVPMGTEMEGKRFLREASVLAAVEHPAIVRYLGHGTLPEGDAYLVMEWLAGQTLGDRLEHGELSIRQTLELGVRLGEALGHAHRIGLIHRDVKPSNVLLAGEQLGGAKLIDFGVARTNELAQHLTATGMIVGTPGFMAPEQARGQGDIDARADVYALGCVLYRCLAGRNAFIGKDAFEVLVQVARGTVGRLSDVRADVPQPVDDALASMLAKEREARPRDGIAVARLLERALAESGLGESVRPSALTVAEQRLVTVVVASIRDAVSWDDPTLVVSAVDPQIASLIEVARSLELEAEILPDRSLLFTIAGADVATDLAARGARLAQALLRADASLRIAVATGLAIHRDGQTLGRVVDVALSSLDPRGGAKIARGEVWVDDVTASLLDGRAALDTTESGYRLRVHDTGPRRLVARLPFQGRERELGFLSATVDDALDEQARVVVISGEAGIGKSRLVEEAVTRARDRTTDIRVLAGRGDPSGKSSPFSIVAQVVRQTLELFEDEAADKQLAKIRRRLASAVSADSLEETVHHLSDLLGLVSRDATSAPSGEALHKGDLMRRAFEQLMRIEAERGPLVFVLDDLQWGDLPSVLAFDGLLRALADRPVVLIGIGRAEIAQVFPGLWAQRNPTQITLGELGKRPAERVVRAALGDAASAESVQRIVDHAAGSPLFLEQLVRSPNPTADDAGLPETVLALVALRFEQLGSAARRTLRAASVFGLAAWVGAVGVLLGSDAGSPSAREAIEELTRAGVIERRERGRFADEEEIVFRNPLLHDAAYVSLTPADRATGHRLAAEWLEAHGERDAVRLAEHWDRASEPSRAAKLFARAAEQALEGADFARCAELAAMARAREPDDTLRGHILAVEVEALAWAGRFDEMVERAKEAIRVLEPGSIDWCSAGAGMLLLGGGSIPVEHLLPIVGSVAFMPLHANASLVHIRIHAIVAMLLYRAGQLPMAENVRDRLLPLESAAETTRLTRGWIEMVKVYASRFGHDRKPHVARDAALAAATHFETAYDLRSQAFALVDAAYAELSLGRIEAGLALANRGRELGSRLGVGFVALYGGGLAASALGRLNRITEARALAREIADASSARRDRINVGFTLHLLAVAEYLAGDYERARELASTAAEQPGLVPPTLSYAYATSARCAVRLGDAEEAMRCAKQAVELMNTVTTNDMAEGWIRLGWIEALGAVGRDDDRAEAIALAKHRLEERASGMTTEERSAFFSLREHAETLALA